MSDRAHIGDAIEQAACDWLAAQSLRTLTVRERRAFEAWLAEDPRHADAYASVAASWNDPSVAAALREVKQAPPARVAAPRPSLLSSRFGLAAVAALAAVAVLAVVVGVRPGPLDDGRTFETAQAEIRDLDLADGSQVTLGAKSRIAVAVDERARRVSLLSGEAYFSIAHDPSRPFTVEVDDTLIRVVGTKFEVHRGPSGVRVRVTEGSVEVIRPPAAASSADSRGSPAPAASSALLTGGEQLLAIPGEPPAVLPVDDDVPGSWRDGRLVYQNALLEEVIADVNRYSAQRITIVSPGLRELRVTATFPTDEVSEMLDLLSTTMPIVADRRDNGDIDLRASDSG